MKLHAAMCAEQYCTHSAVAVGAHAHLHVQQHMLHTSYSRCVQGADLLNRAAPSHPKVPFSGSSAYTEQFTGAQNAAAVVALPQQHVANKAAGAAQFDGTTEYTEVSTCHLDRCTVIDTQSPFCSDLF